MDENKGAMPNGNTPSSNESLQAHNPNVANLANIYPNPNQNRLVTSDDVSRNVEPSTQTNKNNSALKIALLVGIVVLIGAVAIIFIPKLLKSGESEVRETLDNINLVLPNTIDACKRVRDDVGERSLKADLYEAEVDICRESVIDLYEFVDKLDIANNEEVQEAFNNFKVSLDTNMPSPNQLENTLEVYTAMHNFNVALRNFQLDTRSLDYKTGVAEELIAAANYFADSPNDELLQFGNGVKQAYSELYDTWQRFESEINEAGENDQANYNKYAVAEKNFNDYASNGKPDIFSLYPLANDDSGEISNAFNNFVQKTQ